MRSDKALDLLNKGHIEELKQLLSDEIYEEALKKKPGAKNRYTAMKKYFTYVTSVREALTKPAAIEYEGEQYTSFTNSYSLALTKESAGEMELFDKNLNYPDVTRLIDPTGIERKVDFNKIFAEAKSKGYKLKRAEVMGNAYLTRIGDSYYRVGLIEATYGIINDGEPATVYYANGPNSKLTIKNDLGYCLIMPVRFEGIEPWMTIIAAEEI